MVCFFSSSLISIWSFIRSLVHCVCALCIWMYVSFFLCVLLKVDVLFLSHSFNLVHSCCGFGCASVSVRFEFAHRLNKCYKHYSKYHMCVNCMWCKKEKHTQKFRVPIYTAQFAVWVYMLFCATAAAVVAVAADAAAIACVSVFVCVYESRSFHRCCYCC